VGQDDRRAARHVPGCRRPQEPARAQHQHAHLPVGLAVSNFRDNSTRTRFSFASGTNLLGLQLQDLDESKSQIAHGETVRETATMISFMADVIGIRDDKFIGEGDAYMKEVSESVEQSWRDGILDHRPTLVSLQSDSDHPTQSSADMLYLINEFGGLDNLKGKKVAVTWAYSPSYGKPSAARSRSSCC
jgi:ornithine carbamoyltransferase